MTRGHARRAEGCRFESYLRSHFFQELADRESFAGSSRCPFPSPFRCGFFFSCDPQVFRPNGVAARSSDGPGPRRTRRTGCGMLQHCGSTRPRPPYRTGVRLLLRPSGSSRSGSDRGRNWPPRISFCGSSWRSTKNAASNRAAPMMRCASRSFRHDWQFATDTAWTATSPRPYREVVGSADRATVRSAALGRLGLRRYSKFPLMPWNPPSAWRSIHLITRRSL
jgi:hypothetical protein